jgi:hypothetical protein
VSSEDTALLRLYLFPNQGPLHSGAGFSFVNKLAPEVLSAQKLSGIQEDLFLTI